MHLELHFLCTDSSNYGVKWIKLINNDYHKTFHTRCTKLPNLNDSHLLWQLSLSNPLKPGVMLRTKISWSTPTGDAPSTSEWSTIFHCLLRCGYIRGLMVISLITLIFLLVKKERWNIAYILYGHISDWMLPQRRQQIFSNVSLFMINVINIYKMNMLITLLSPNESYLYSNKLQHIIVDIYPITEPWAHKIPAMPVIFLLFFTKCKLWSRIQELMLNLFPNHI